MERKTIRFIDTNYKTLFTIKDGDSIVINLYDGVRVIAKCKYEGECHVTVGNYLYHIHEFAQKMEKAGNTYAPAPDRDSSQQNRQPKSNDDRDR